MKRLLLLLLLSLAGCTTMNGSAAPAIARCDAAPAQMLLGKPATAALVDRVRRLSGATVSRRITPEMRVTMEFLEGRVNIWVGIDGSAERITCG